MFLQQEEALEREKCQGDAYQQLDRDIQERFEKKDWKQRAVQAAEREHLKG